MGGGTTEHSARVFASAPYRSGGKTGTAQASPSTRATSANAAKLANASTIRLPAFAPADKTQWSRWP